jgi:hypothetical protein
MDERGNLPSASAASRYAACLGSWQLERQVAEIESSGDAATGNRIHAALGLEPVTNLTTDETYIIDRCREQEAELVKQVFSTSTEEPQVFREKRLWSLQNYGLGEEDKRLWSGKPDVVYVEGNSALIIDYKSGRGSVENAAENLQLRCLVALLHESFGFTLEAITVAIVQPLAGPPSVATYELGDLMDAVRESQSLMAAIMQSDQPRTPSESACKYCKGKPYCSEARELAVTGPLANAPEGITPDAIASTLTSSHLAQFLDRAAQAEAVIEACRSEARRRLTEGETVEGWALKDGSVRESISNSEIVASRFLELGTYEQLSPAITLNKTKLKDAVKLATGTKGRDLEAKLTALLDGCTESKMSQPMLVKIK